MAIKLSRVVTYGQKNPHIKSCYLLNKWSRDKCKTLYLAAGEPQVQSSKFKVR